MCNSAIQTVFNGKFVIETLPHRQIGTDNPSMDIGRAIYTIRKETGLKLEAVAFDAGTDTGHLSRIEKGNRKPSLDMLEKIAAALGVRTSLIVAMAESASDSSGCTNESLTGETDLSEEAIQLRQNYRALTPENKLIAVELIKTLNRTQGSD